MLQVSPMSRLGGHAGSRGSTGEEDVSASVIGQES